MRLSGPMIVVGALALMSATQAEAGGFSRTTLEDQPVRIASHATWNGACLGKPALVEVVEPPQHGTLFAKSEKTSIRRIEAGSLRCLGYPVTAKAVYYKPERGFRGTDEFYYTSTTRSGTVLPHEGTVVVR